MERGNLKLQNPERFAGSYEIPAEKLDVAIKKACDKLLGKLDIYAHSYKQNLYHPEDVFKYDMGPNNSWVAGMQTGTLVIAYELTGDKRFLDTAISNLPDYRERIDKKIKINDHDVGFFICPSCVAIYKASGNEDARDIALDAAKYFYDHSYTEKGGFIRLQVDGEHKQGCGRNGKPEILGPRTIMDTLMNSPLLLWAGQELGEQKYIDAAIAQVKTTEKCLMRADGSTYHHYRFDEETHEPLYGLTFQGNRDESTWSRGHAWGVIGVPVVYEATKDPEMLKMHHDLAYFMLNHLPEDLVPYWDFDFTSGDEPRDSSAGAICAAGLLEMAELLPDSSPDKQLFRTAGNKMLEAVIDKYAGDIGREYDGLLWGVTGARKFDIIIEGCDTYGDFFYMEALLRAKNPACKRLR